MSIIDKLKLEKYTNLVVINEPEDYSVFKDCPNTYSKEHDAIFVFALTIDEMVKQTQYIIDHNLLMENGYLFIAYPKKGNKRYETYIHRDDIFPAMDVKVGENANVLGSDIKFARMVSLDDVFTVVGLKREKKKSKPSSAASQCVADYVDQVGDVQALLKNHPSELEFYNNLTPGYQTDWARFIFSAKQQKTRDKRAEQMVEVLSEGYKTMDLYRMKKK